MLEQTWQRALDDEQKMHERDRTCPKVIPNGCQEMPKTSQMATKVPPKRSQIRVDSPKLEWRAQVSIFLRFSGHSGRHLGIILVSRARKNISQKTTENQARTNIENHSQRSWKRCQNASQIGYQNHVKSELAISVFFPRVPRNN